MPSAMLLLPLFLCLLAVACALACAAVAILLSSTRRRKSHAALSPTQVLLQLLSSTAAASVSVAMPTVLATSSVKFPTAFKRSKTKLRSKQQRRSLVEQQRHLHQKQTLSGSKLVRSGSFCLGRQASDHISDSSLDIHGLSGAAEQIACPSAYSTGQRDEEDSSHEHNLGDTHSTESEDDHLIVTGNIVSLQESTLVDSIMPMRLVHESRIHPSAPVTHPKLIIADEEKDYSRVYDNSRHLFYTENNLPPQSVNIAKLLLAADHETSAEILTCKMKQLSNDTVDADIGIIYVDKVDTLQNTLLAPSSRDSGYDGLFGTKEITMDLELTSSTESIITSPPPLMDIDLTFKNGVTDQVMTRESCIVVESHNTDLSYTPLQHIVASQSFQQDSASYLSSISRSDALMSNKLSPTFKYDLGRPNKESIVSVTTPNGMDDDCSTATATTIALPICNDLMAQAAEQDLTVTTNHMLNVDSYEMVTKEEPRLVSLPPQIVDVLPKPLSSVKDFCDITAKYSIRSIITNLFNDIDLKHEKAISSTHATKFPNSFSTITNVHNDYLLHLNATDAVPSTDKSLPSPVASPVSDHTPRLDIEPVSPTLFAPQMRAKAHTWNPFSGLQLDIPVHTLLGIEPTCEFTVRNILPPLNITPLSDHTISQQVTQADINSTANVPMDYNDDEYDSSKYQQYLHGHDMYTGPFTSTSLISPKQHPLISNITKGRVLPYHSTIALPKLYPPARMPYANYQLSLLQHHTSPTSTFSTMPSTLQNHPYATQCPSVTSTPAPRSRLYPTKHSPPLTKPMRTRSGSDTFTPVSEVPFSTPFRKQSLPLQHTNSGVYGRTTQTVSGTNGVTMTNSTHFYSPSHFSFSTTGENNTGTGSTLSFIHSKRGRSNSGGVRTKHSNGSVKTNDSEQQSSGHATPFVHSHTSTFSHEYRRKSTTAAPQYQYQYQSHPTYKHRFVNSNIAFIAATLGNSDNNKSYDSTTTTVLPPVNPITSIDTPSLF